MKTGPSNRLKGIGSYAFAEVDKEVAKLKKQGIKPIDFGVGDPKDPTPKVIREACKKAVEKRATAGYPSYIGEPDFREAVAKWMKKRFNVKLDLDKEISSTIGAKESVFNFPEAFVNPGDYVISPNPGYPPYERGTLFAEGKNYFYNLTEENNFYPELDKIPKDVVKKAKILWVNYPNNPTTQIATKGFYKELIDFGNDNKIIIASDEPYTENYYDKKPISILEVGKENVIVFQSLSKMSNMTSYRVGWVCGDEAVVETFKKLKTNIDSGTATFIQDATVAALKNNRYMDKLRKDYKVKRDLLIKAMVNAGLEKCEPKATIYIWQKCPDGLSSVDFAKKLLTKDIAVVTTPGSWISNKLNGINPGEGYVRFALVPTIEECKQAAKRIEENLRL
jgi:LL-diaminopimelate aminotransferase